jgi:hypothetical protein
MGDQGGECVGLDSIPAELLHSILASRDSLRCRDLGRLACTCQLFRLFTTTPVFTAPYARSSSPTTAHVNAAALSGSERLLKHRAQAIELRQLWPCTAHVNAAAQAIVAHRWSLTRLVELGLGLQYWPTSSQHRLGQGWLQALGKLEQLEDRMRGWTGACVVGQDVWDHRMCVFDGWVKEAEAIPALTNLLNDVFGAREIRSHMEIMVGSTVIVCESAIKTFEMSVHLDDLGDRASAYGFVVRFYRATLSWKEHTLLAPWIEKLNDYGSEVHNSTSYQA